MKGLLEKLKKAFIILLFCKFNYKAFKNKIFAFRPTILYISKHAHISIKGGLYFNQQWDYARMKQNVLPGSLYIGEESLLEVSDFICRPGCRVTVNKGAALRIGSGFLNAGSIIECFNSISIGENCFISEGVVIRDSNDHIICREGYVKSLPVVIGNNVWIGMGSIILSGVHIGDGSVVAAGSIVNRDVPKHSLVGGNPAHIIRQNVEWKKK